ncbi:MAG: hypothetical protein JXR83_16870 [Deltaproteobacteria bacterium]|nr:hypothetical protein [Deltaproteobacteria bacterium]
MVTTGRARARWQLLIARLLAMLIACALVEAPPLASPAAASPAWSVRAAADAALAKKKKKKSKKKKKKKKKKPAKPEEPLPAAAAVAVVAFEGDGGGQMMANQVTQGITKFAHTSDETMGLALSPGENRFSEESIKAALAVTKTTALIRGTGTRGQDTVTVRVVAYAADGKPHWAETFTTLKGEVDPLALAPQISDEIEKILPTLASLPEVPSLESAPLPTEQPALQTTAQPTADPFAKPAPSGTTVTQKVEPTPSRKEPLFALGAGLDVLYWSYDLRSNALESTVYWHPLEPYLGAAVGGEIWPLPWIGVDLHLDFGMHSYVDTAENPLPISESKIDVTALEAQFALRGRYVLDFGLGLGAHFAYRYLGTFVSAQSFTIAPGFGAHLLSPGADLYFTTLAPWLTVRLAADVVPFGFYGESPDSPGDKDQAGLWGWRFDGAVRSTFFLGIYAELSFFYELYYITYQGEGDRHNSLGATVADAVITNGMRGMMLGVGWSY